MALAYADEQRAVRTQSVRLEKDQALPSGFDAYLTRPLDVVKLLAEFDAASATNAAGGAAPSPRS